MELGLPSPRASAPSPPLDSTRREALCLQQVRIVALTPHRGPQASLPRMSQTIKDLYCEAVRRSEGRAAPQINPGSDSPGTAKRWPPAWRWGSSGFPRAQIHADKTLEKPAEQSPRSRGAGSRRPGGGGSGPGTRTSGTYRDGRVRGGRGPRLSHRTPGHAPAPSRPRPRAHPATPSHPPTLACHPGFLRAPPV